MVSCYAAYVWDQRKGGTAAIKNGIHKQITNASWKQPIKPNKSNCSLYSVHLLREATCLCRYMVWLLFAWPPMELQGPSPVLHFMDRGMSMFSHSAYFPHISLKEKRCVCFSISLLRNYSAADW